MRDEAIMADLASVNPENKGYLFVGGSKVDNQKCLIFKGNPIILAESINQLMEVNSEFNRIMFSIFGYYLMVNQEERHRRN